MSIQKASLADDDFKRAFIEGNLAIDCLEITLTQNGRPVPRVYKASGSIQISPELGAEGRVVWQRDEAHPYDFMAAFKASQDVASGEILPDDHYFSLDAIDINGNRWTNPSVHVLKEEKPQGEILRFSCDFIETNVQIESNRAVAHYVFAKDLGIPLNKTSSVTEPVRAGQRISVKKSGSAGQVVGFELAYYPVAVDKSGEAYEIVGVGAPGVEHPQGFGVRLLESVQFCTARLAWPIMTEVIHMGRSMLTLSKSVPYNNGLVPAPLPSHASQNFFQLMACYYVYACAEGKETDAAPLMRKIAGLFTLKGVWLDTIALLLSVSVESILNDPVYAKLGKPDKSALDLIENLFDWVGKAPVGEKLVQRATSALGNMKSTRAVDKMFALAKAGVIDEDEIRAWKALRNPSAHGSFEPDPSKLQELLDNVYRLVAMIYKLAFYRIDYTGLYLNFAARGWRPTEFDAAACRANLYGSQSPATA